MDIATYKTRLTTALVRSFGDTLPFLYNPLTNQTLPRTRLVHHMDQRTRYAIVIPARGVAPSRLVMVDDLQAVMSCLVVGPCTIYDLYAERPVGISCSLNLQ